ncbi:MAG: Hint domain-containing protein [Bacteroidota bacterium]
MKRYLIFLCFSLFLFSAPVRGQDTLPEALCNCPKTCDPVCGKDGRVYLNKCVAKCFGVKIRSNGNCPDRFFKQDDTLTWHVREICDPVSAPSKNLGDGTYFYQRINERGVPKIPCYKKCLPSGAMISTPAGNIAIKDLQPGDTVWTTNYGQKGYVKIAVPVLLKDSVKVTGKHKMVQIKLEDGRTVTASPKHPVATHYSIDGLFESMEVGQKYDGSTIIKKKYVPYKKPYTYDILTSGVGGGYWVNGVRIASSLALQGEDDDPVRLLYARKSNVLQGIPNPTPPVRYFIRLYMNTNEEVMIKSLKIDNVCMHFDKILKPGSGKTKSSEKVRVFSINGCYELIQLSYNGYAYRVRYQKNSEECSGSFQPTYVDEEAELTYTVNGVSHTLTFTIPFKPALGLPPP